MVLATAASVSSPSAQHNGGAVISQEINIVAAQLEIISMSELM